MEVSRLINGINLSLSFLLFPALFLSMFGIYGIDKYINWVLYLVFLLFFCGILSFIFSVFLFKKFKKPLDKKGVKAFVKQNYIFKFSLISLLVLFGSVSLLSEAYSKGESIRKFAIINKGASGFKKKRQYYLFLNQSGKTIRYAFGKSTHDLYEIGDSINLSLKSNLFGFEYYEPANMNEQEK